MTNKKRHKDNRGIPCDLCCTQIQNFNVVRGKNVILENVNLHVHCGELTALIGPNGAGKSTLLKAILGDVKHSGDLKFLDAKGIHTGHPRIGYVPQQLDFDHSTPATVYDFFAACTTKKSVWFSHSVKIRDSILEVLARADASHLIDRKLGALSGGEMQRILLALALDPLPDILLLDEPISGIDQKGMELFYHTVSSLRDNYDLTIILISHDLPLLAQYADRVVYLNKAVICSGTPEEVFLHSEVIGAFGKVIM